MFKLLNFLTTGALQDYIGRSGGAEALLHYGSRVTPRMGVSVEFTTDNRTSQYFSTLASAAPDTLIFTSEEVTFHRTGSPEPQRIPLGAAGAPSKRIIDKIPEYASRKSSAGPDILKLAGLTTLSARCPHFAPWLARMESLATQ